MGMWRCTADPRLTSDPAETATFKCRVFCFFCFLSPLSLSSSLYLNFVSNYGRPRENRHNHHHFLTLNWFALRLWFAAVLIPWPSHVQLSKSHTPLFRYHTPIWDCCNRCPSSVLPFSVCCMQFSCWEIFYVKVVRRNCGKTLENSENEKLRQFPLQSQIICSLCVCSVRIDDIECI